MTDEYDIGYDAEIIEEYRHGSIAASDEDAWCEAALRVMMKNRYVAHQILFPHRHVEASPEYHREMIERLHDGGRQDIFEIFRGGGKSTLAEESRIIRALFKEYHNCIIIGSSWERAVERLRSIRHELESNAMIARLFGEVVGSTWTDSRIVLRNGVVIQAYGRGQSLRGVKHFDKRPDDCLCDDFEDDDSTRTKDSIQNCLSWFFKALVPALDPKANIDIVGTPLDPESVLVQLSQDKDWRTMVVGIEYIDEEGNRQPSWPARFPLEMIDARRESYARKGLLTEYGQEYMCTAQDESQKAFNPGMIRVLPRVRVWEPVYSFHDPARTTKKTSAQTGVAIWSWVGNRLVVWDAYGRFYKPDEIYDDIFKIHDNYQPVEQGVEEDSLNEFLLQPLRQEMVKRGTPLPLRPMKAPNNKQGFIRSLVQFFKAGEVEFAKELPELQAQMFNFPNGLIDVLNALAYAPRMRPGVVIYDDFSTQNVQEELLLDRQGMILALNCTESMTAGVLISYHDGVLKILEDWVQEGDPGQRLHHILDAAALDYGHNFKLRAAAVHFDRYRNRGLVQAARSAGRELMRAGDEYKGRQFIRRLLTSQRRGMPCLQVSTRARWTLNAFAGGYAKDVTKTNMPREMAVDNHYRLLMEGLEATCGAMNSSVDNDMPDGVHYAVTRDGREYLSAQQSARPR